MAEACKQLVNNTSPDFLEQLTTNFDLIKKIVASNVPIEILVSLLKQSRVPAKNELIKMFADDLIISKILAYDNFSFSRELELSDLRSDLLQFSINLKFGDYKLDFYQFDNQGSIDFELSFTDEYYENFGAVNEEFLQYLSKIRDSLQLSPNTTTLFEIYNSLFLIATSGTDIGDNINDEDRFGQKSFEMMQRIYKIK